MDLDTTAVRVWMAKKGIRTQKALAAKIGLSPSALSELLSGQRSPTLDTLGALCEALGCTANDLLIQAPKEFAPAPLMDQTQDFEFSPEYELAGA